MFASSLPASLPFAGKAAAWTAHITPSYPPSHTLHHTAPHHSPPSSVIYTKATLYTHGPLFHRNPRCPPPPGPMPKPKRRVRQVSSSFLPDQSHTLVSQAETLQILHTLQGLSLLYQPKGVRDDGRVFLRNFAHGTARIPHRRIDPSNPTRNVGLRPSIYPIYRQSISPSPIYRSPTINPSLPRRQLISPWQIYRQLITDRRAQCSVPGANSPFPWPT